MPLRMPPSRRGASSSLAWLGVVVLAIAVVGFAVAWLRDLDRAPQGSPSRSSGGSAKASATSQGTAPPGATVSQPDTVTYVAAKGFGDSAAIRPSTISGGDNDELLRLSWNTWDPGGATASGILSLNTCTPECAAANYERYHVRILLTSPTWACGRYFFSKMKVLRTDGDGSISDSWTLTWLRPTFKEGNGGTTPC